MNKLTLKNAPKAKRLTDDFVEVRSAQSTPPEFIDDNFEDGANHEEIERNEKRPQGVSPLAKEYLARAVNNLKRPVAPTLSTNYRTKMSHFRDLLLQCEAKGQFEGQSLITVATACAVTSKGDALMLLKRVMSQVLWQAASDVQRDRRDGNVYPNEVKSAPYGLHDASSNEDAITGFAGPQERTLVREEDAVLALGEINVVLSSLADSFMRDDQERAYFQLEDGLEFTQRVEEVNGVKTYKPVHDIDQALDVQFVQNQVSRARANQRQIESTQAQRTALAAMLA
jgi:hypothetical protein